MPLPSLRLVSTAVCCALFTLSSVGVANAHPSTQRTASKKVVVKITNFKFKPKRITVKVGTKVVWVNKDSTQHTATANNFSFNTGTISPNHRGHHRFKKVGVFKYHCIFHSFMHGRVKVIR